MSSRLKTISVGLPPSTADIIGRSMDVVVRPTAPVYLCDVTFTAWLMSHVVLNDPFSSMTTNKGSYLMSELGIDER